MADLTAIKHLKAWWPHHHRYGDILTYNQIANLYENSVYDILNIYNVKCIIDLPFGKGLTEAAYRWEEKLGEAKKKVIKNE